MPQRLLVVDDSPAIRRLVARIVAAAGLPFECMAAGTGREALEMVRRAPAALILTDINMPVMDGEELVGHLREDPALRDIPVIVLSTDSTRARANRMEAAGARGYLAKPFTAETLRNEVERVLGNLHA
ncbi:MAG TPA: response regulator [Verrucomicrobiae bacterium]|nr:response regulator [Verrucomicrobiae bacterium]